MENTTNITSKNIKKFHCEKCDFRCFKKGDFNRHLNIKKHNTTNTTKIQPKILHHCECGKKYAHRASLFNHKKTCDYEENDDVLEKNMKEPMLEYLLKENVEVKKILIDVCQKLEPISNNTINSNNSIVNINMFLNEQCKDAMNITEFIESIQLSLDDMTNIATTGQTQGMTSILIDRLSSLDVLKRPLHCSDLKKETIYIKDEDKWEQDSKTKPKMKSVLDKLTKKGIDAMPIMEDDPDSYVKTITEVIKEPREDKKIINSVIKEILIN